MKVIEFVYDNFVYYEITQDRNQNGKISEKDSRRNTLCSL